jgi:hypothetical protein
LSHTLEKLTCRFRPTIFNVCSPDLLTFTANFTLTGNRIHLHLNGWAKRPIGKLGIKTLSLAARLVTVVDQIKKLLSSCKQVYCHYKASVNSGLLNEL